MVFKPDTRQHCGDSVIFTPWLAASFKYRFPSLPITLEITCVSSDSINIAISPSTLPFALLTSILSLELGTRVGPIFCV